MFSAKSSFSLRVIIDELESALRGLKVEKVACDELGLRLRDALLGTDLRNKVKYLVSNVLASGTKKFMSTRMIVCGALCLHPCTAAQQSG